MIIMLHEKAMSGPYSKTKHTYQKPVMKTWLFSLHLKVVVTAHLWLRSKQGIQKTAQGQTKLKYNHQRERRGRNDTWTVMSAPTPIYNTPYANEIPHTGLISTNAMCFATIVVAQDVRISHEHKLAVLVFKYRLCASRKRSDVFNETRITRNSLQLFCLYKQSFTNAVHYSTFFLSI